MWLAQKYTIFKSERIAVLTLMKEYVWRSAIAANACRFKYENI